MIPLYDYQREYFSHVDKRNWIYNMDTGTGKTIMALTHYQVFFSDKPLVIFAPASKVKEGGWQRTIEEFHIKKEYTIISYNKMPKQYKDTRDCFVIFDEAHRVKESTGVWGKTANLIVHKYCAGFVLLTATPLSNGWIDSINYFKMFHMTPCKYHFLQQHAIVDTRRGYPEILGWRNTSRLEKNWQKISRRLNKSEAIDLPELVEKKVYFTADPKYKKIKKLRVSEGKTYDNMMAWRHGLRSNTSSDDKMQYILDLLEDVESNIIIFYNYDAELEHIKKSIKDRIVYQCNGHCKSYPKKEDWGRVANTVTLANYKSGSEAVEFTYADLIIYFSPTESYTEYYQSVGRCHRIGQKNKVTIYKFITRDTIEENIYESLDKKEDFNFESWLINDDKCEREIQ